MPGIPLLKPDSALPPASTTFALSPEPALLDCACAAVLKLAALGSTDPGIALPAVTAPSPGGSTNPAGVAVGRLSGREELVLLGCGVDVRNFERPIVADSVCGVCGALARPFGTLPLPVTSVTEEAAVVTTLSARVLPLPLLLRMADEAGVSDTVDRVYADEIGSGVPVPPADPAKLEGDARRRFAGETPASTLSFSSTDSFKVKELGR